MTKSYLAIALISLAALAFTPSALAHGSAKAKHGGIVAVVNDLSFELVGTPDGAMIYIDDHGKAVAPKGMKGKLTVMSGSEKTEAELVVAGDKLEAKGIALAKGAKVVAALITAENKAMTVRFLVK